jgi:hypothetical protein
MDTFVTLAGDGVAQTRVKGSTFAALAAPAPDEAEARARLAAREREMWDATHHGSAWRMRGGTVRANDAGEPSGSTGAPILAAIDGAGLTDCVVIVTRYYGGTKLGVGGLVRAYGDAAAEALAAAPRRVGTGGVSAHPLPVRAHGGGDEGAGAERRGGGRARVRAGGGRGDRGFQRGGERGSAPPRRASGVHGGRGGTAENRRHRALSERGFLSGVFI